MKSYAGIHGSDNPGATSYESGLLRTVSYHDIQCDSIEVLHLHDLQIMLQTSRGLETEAVTTSITTQKNHSSAFTSQTNNSLDDTDLVCNIQCISISSQLYVSLLQTIRSTAITKHDKERNSYRTSVFTLAAETSYMRFTACAIWRLLL